MIEKRILIIGDANSFLLHDIVYNIRTSQKLLIDILNTNTGQKFIDLNIYNRVMYPSKIFFNIQKITDIISPYLSFFSLRFFIKKSLKYSTAKYDAVHIHFFNKNFLFIDVVNIQRITNELIITFWGSDFYKRDNAQRNKMKPYLNLASKIIFSNPDMKEHFTSYFNDYFSKCQVIATGLDILSHIDLLESKNLTKKSIKHELSIDPNKIVITIGYSSHQDNHQIEIIEQITKRGDKNYLNNIHFVFPLTYGDVNYKQKIIRTAQRYNLNFTALTHPLPKDLIAMYRLASDIMIHLRDTDQFSGSFQEYLYSNNIVITGNWLPYQFIIDKGIFMYSVSKIDELSDKLNFVLANLESEILKTIGNKKIIAEISHWNVLTEKHISIYD